MKKMLAKAVALSLVLGGVGFVANDALAADIGPAVDVETIYGDWDKVLSHKDGQAINAEVATNKANIAKNAENISANQKAIDKEVKDRQDAITQERNARTVADLNLGEQITQEKNARVEADNKLSEAIKTEEKARKYDSLILDDKITQEKNARIDADKAEAAAREDADKALRADLNQETIDRVDADNRLQTAIDQKADKTTVAENTAAIESNKAAIAQEKKDRDHADQKLQDQITINKGQIENEATNRANEDKRIEAKFDGEVSRLDGRIDKLDANVEKVGAMAAAIANLHTMGYDPEAPTEIAVGVGQYRDKTGLALGAFHYPNRDFMLSFNVSTAGDEFMGGIGATWKFGRKSPEELRQAEAEKAAKAKLAKAEAAKKAAKDARVAAQQKRHAEMLAARTGK
ncbi:YadA C-terminal domain-containing protein [Phascolarctobacterium succinatutens]|uniref:YadA C-terminal domain-containing protein n=1 Tax=Phascolarctobacterium succinatutens TaxID=626940 RepID=UPI0027B8C617|nr:YadA C-terminal domain-containing protein [Phascolarctobacterium succinatutens]